MSGLTETKSKEIPLLATSMNKYSILIKPLFLVIIFTMPPSLVASNGKPECKNVKFTFNKERKNRTIDLQLCKKMKKDQTMLLTQNCLQGECNALKELTSKKKEKPTILETRNIGSPNFRKCHQLGGLPLRGKLTDLITDRKTMLCFFSSDDSIVNTETLFLWE